MKKLIKLMLIMVCGVMITTTFVACGSDDDASFTTEQLIGKWINTKRTWYDSRDSQPEEYTYSGNTRYLQLNADGTGKVNPLNLFESEIRKSFTWKLSGNVLTITESDGDVVSFTVTHVSSTNLELTWFDNFEGISIKEISAFTRAKE